MDIPSWTSRIEWSCFGLAIAPWGPSRIIRCRWGGTLYFCKTLHIKTTTPIFILKNQLNIGIGIQASTGWVSRNGRQGIIINNGQRSIERFRPNPCICLGTQTDDVIRRKVVIGREIGHWSRGIVNLGIGWVSVTIVSSLGHDPFLGG